MSEARSRPLSRRLVLGGGAAVGLAAPLTGLGMNPAAAEVSSRRLAVTNQNARRAAAGFLQQVTDAYRRSGFRLAQSYEDTRINDIAFIYDNALTTIALLANGDTTRARAIGDALLYAQNHDAIFNDGRLRQAYHANGFLNPDQTAHDAWELSLNGTSVGDMSWSGMALAHLARRTGVASYREGALRIGRWIFDHTYSTTGLGGYTFGETAGLADHKSTEHNIDVYGFFLLLAKLTGDQVWRTRAEHAKGFVKALWNAGDGFFWTGSDDGTAINKKSTQLPLDPQTWSWMSIGQRGYAKSLDWAATNLATTDTPMRTNSALVGSYCASGVGFSSGTFRTDVNQKVGGHDWTPQPDDSAVWFEGTAQLALALRLRADEGDRAAADVLLTSLRSAQTTLGRGQVFNGKTTTGGIVASSSPMDTGFGFDYSPNLHIGATAWYFFAVTGFNPFKFNY